MAKDNEEDIESQRKAELARLIEEQNADDDSDRPKKKGRKKTTEPQGGSYEEGPNGELHYIPPEEGYVKPSKKDLPNAVSKGKSSIAPGLYEDEEGLDYKVNLGSKSDNALDKIKHPKDHITGESPPEEGDGVLYAVEHRNTKTSNDIVNGLISRELDPENLTPEQQEEVSEWLGTAYKSQKDAAGREISDSVVFQNADIPKDIQDAIEKKRKPFTDEYTAKVLTPRIESLEAVAGADYTDVFIPPDILTIIKDSKKQASLNDALDWQSFKDIPAGSSEQIIAANQKHLERLEAEREGNLRLQSNYGDMLTDLTKKHLDGDITDAIYEAEKRKIVRITWPLKVTIRNQTATINRIAKLTESPGDQMLRQAEDLSLSFEDSYTRKAELSKLEQTGRFRSNIEAAQRHFLARTKNIEDIDPTQLGKDISSEFDKFSNLDDYLKALSENEGSESRKAITSYRLGLKEASVRADEAIQRSIIASRGREANLLRLYGLNALPESGQEMGRAITVSGGVLHGSEVNIVRPEGGINGPTYTDKALWKPSTKENRQFGFESTHRGWTLNPNEDPLGTPDHAVRLRPVGIRAKNLGGVDITLRSEGIQRPTLNAFADVDSRHTIAQAYDAMKDREKDERTSSDSEEVMAALNKRIGHKIQTNISHSATFLDSIGEQDQFAGRSILGGFTGNSTLEGKIFAKQLGLSAEEMTPERIASELMTGLLYGEDKKMIFDKASKEHGNKYIRLLRYIQGDESGPLGKEVVKIVGHTAPELVEQGMPDKEDIPQIMKDWASASGIESSNSARLAIYSRNRDLFYKKRSEINASLGTDPRTAMHLTQDALDNIYESSAMDDEAVEGITLNNLPIGGTDADIETFMPFAHDTAKGRRLRREAIDHLGMSNKAKRTHLGALGREFGTAYANDVENMAGHIEEAIAIESAKLSDSLKPQIAKITEEPTKAFAGSKVHKEMVRRVALNVHQQMQRNAYIESEIDRIKNIPIINMPTSKKRTQIEGLIKIRAKHGNKVLEPLRYNPLSAQTRDALDSETDFGIEGLKKYMTEAKAKRNALELLGGDRNKVIASYFERASGEADRSPFVGRSMSDIYARLDELSTQHGHQIEMHIPEFTKNYNKLFGIKGQHLIQEVTGVYPLASNQISNLSGFGVTSEISSVLDTEERARQLAAYRLPKYMEEWGHPANIKDHRLLEEDSEGRLSDLAMDRAMQSAKKELRENGGTFSIDQEFKGEILHRPTETELRPLAEAYVRSTMSEDGTRVGNFVTEMNEKGLPLIPTETAEHHVESQTNALLKQIQDNYGWKPILDESGEDTGLFEPGPSASIIKAVATKNTESMDQIESISDVRLRQGTGDWVGVNIGQAESSALYNQAYNPTGFAKNAKGKKELKSGQIFSSTTSPSQYMNASITNSQFMPSVNGSPVRQSTIDEAVGQISSGLEEEGINWEHLNNLSSVLEHNGGIDLSSLENEDDATRVRELMGMHKDEKWLSSPLARSNKVILEAEDDPNKAQTTAQLFSDIITKNNLTRSDFESHVGGEGSLSHITEESTANELRSRVNNLDGLINSGEAHTLHGPAIKEIARLKEQLSSNEGISAATRDRMAEEVFKITSKNGEAVDLRSKTSTQTLVNFLSKRYKGALHPDMDSIYQQKIGSNTSTIIDEIREAHNGNIPHKAEEATRGAERAHNAYRPPTRLWQHPAREARELWNTGPLAKAGILGSAAFLASGMIYGHVQKDRTKQDMQGPPNLPGGNPYQDNLQGTSISHSPKTQGRPSNNSGMEYTIRAHGNLDPSQFQGEVSQIVGTNSISGSRYSYPTPAGTDHSSDITKKYTS